MRVVCEVSDLDRQIGTVSAKLLEALEAINRSPLPTERPPRAKVNAAASPSEQLIRDSITSPHASAFLTASLSIYTKLSNEEFRDPLWF